MQWIITKFNSSIHPTPQKIVLTIDTCGAAVMVYISLFFFSLSLLLFVPALYSYLAGNLVGVALSFLGASDMHALNLSSNDPKFKKLQRFIKNVIYLYLRQTDEGRKQSVAL